jgi:hypothetical protein
VETIFVLSDHLGGLRDLEPDVRGRGWYVRHETFDAEPRLSPQLSIDVPPDSRWIVSEVTPGDITWAEFEPAARETLERLQPSRILLVEFHTHTLPSLLSFLAALDPEASVALDEDLTLRVWPVSAKGEVLGRFRRPEQ